MNNLCVLTHTHSDCKDIWPLYSAKMQKHVGLRHVAVSNYFIEDDSLIYQFQYDDNQLFSERLEYALEKIPDEYILFMLEDYIPYADIDTNFISSSLVKMDLDRNIGFIRLLQSGAYKLCDYDDKLYVIHPDEYYLFSTQATIWRRTVLLDLVKSCEIKTVRNEPETSPFLKKLNKIGLCTNKKGNSVGGHFDSVYLPYIATACVAGKWNISEYPMLFDMLKEFKIDLNLRGIR
jgi:hypothetical protein